MQVRRLIRKKVTVTAVFLWSQPQQSQKADTVAKLSEAPQYNLNSTVLYYSWKLECYHLCSFRFMSQNVNISTLYHDVVKQGYRNVFSLLTAVILFSVSGFDYSTSRKQKHRVSFSVHDCPQSSSMLCFLPFTDCVIFHCIYLPPFVYPFADEYLCCFSLLDNCEQC